MTRGVVVAGLASLGLIGGAGAVTYSDDGTPTVTVAEPAASAAKSAPAAKPKPTKSTVTLKTTGRTYSCPVGTEAKMSPYDVTAGRVELTLRRVRRQEHTIDKHYPGKTAPKAIADRYNALLDRDKRLVGAYNRAVRKTNAIIDSDCT